jgi:hypothetical protein
LPGRKIKKSFLTRRQHRIATAYSLEVSQRRTTADRRFCGETTKQKDDGCVVARLRPRRNDTL